MSDRGDGREQSCSASDRTDAGCESLRGSECGALSGTGSAECCAPGAGGGECCAPAVGLRGRLRLLVFLVVMAAAAAVLAHALTRKAEPVAAGTGTLAADPASHGGETGKAASGGSAETADPSASLGPVAADKEAVFVLLPGDDQRAAEAAATVVKAAVAKIGARGRHVAALTLERGDPEYARLLGRLSITEFPSVIAQGQGCGETVVTGEITEAKLLQAFVVASQPASSCGTASTCDPSGCR